MKVSVTQPPANRSIRHHTRIAFTLVELLVVIGIIALLIAILMPTLGRARESANSLKCQAQQTQIYQAMVLHAHEHRGYMPLTGRPPGLDPASLEDPRREKYDYFGNETTGYHLMSVVGALAPMVGQQVNTESKATLEADMQQGTLRNLFVCPSDRDGGRIGVTVWEGGDAYCSFGFSDAALGWGTSTMRDGSGLTANPIQHSRLRGKVSSFVHPAELFLLGDGAPRSYANLMLVCDVDANLTLRDVFVTTNGPANNPHASVNPPPGIAADWDAIDYKRHRARMNITFADGHNENVPLTEGALSKVSLNKDFPAF